MKSKGDSVHYEKAALPELAFKKDPLAKPTAVFILIGKTGVGKSSFVKLLGGKTHEGKDPDVGEGIDSCTVKTTAYYANINNKEIIIVDTPGFDDSGVENLDILAGILSILYVFALRKSELQIHGVIFLHDISEVRFSGSQRKTLSILKALCGKECMGNVVIGTTKWSLEKAAKFKKEEERERVIMEKHWEGIYKTARLIDENDETPVVQIVNDLLAKAPILLCAQREMLVSPHKPGDTTVGKLVIPEAELEMRQMRKEHQIMFEEQRQQFEEYKARSDAEKKELEEKLAKQMKEFGENSEASKETKQELAELKEERQRREEERAKNEADSIKNRGFAEGIFHKFKNGELNFAEKFGLAIAAPIILAPAGLVAAPVGIIAAFVGLSNHFTKGKNPEVPNCEVDPEKK